MVWCGVQHLLVQWGYIALFLVTAISAFGVPIGSELVMAYGGALASGQILTGPKDHFSLGLVIVIAVVLIAVRRSTNRLADKAELAYPGPLK